jgi:hypothetical protein
VTRHRARSVISTLVLAAGLLAIFAQPAGASAHKVLFVNGVDGGCTGDTGVADQLAGMPGVTRVDSFNASVGTPTAAQLDPYDEVVALSDCNGFQDGTALGDNLADYADHGGVVVEYAFTNEPGAPDELMGRWQSGGHSPYVPGNNVDNNVTLGTFDASSPLMAGVSTLTSTGCNTDPTLAPGATRVAMWDTGQEAIAFKGQAMGVTASIDDSGCPRTGDYAQLTLNAVKTLQRPPSGTTISLKKINRKRHKARFEFSAGLHADGFECALGRAKKKAKKSKQPKQPTFSACSSPKLYKHLRSGKYTFEARATNSGGPDAVPAVKKFKI